MKKDESNYTVEVRCTNCGYRGEVTFQKGNPIAYENCPGCDCCEVLELDE